MQVSPTTFFFIAMVNRILSSRLYKIALWKVDNIHIFSQIVLIYQGDYLPRITENSMQVNCFQDSFSLLEFDQF